MKTDESVTFDYLNPDFTILKKRKLVFVTMQPQHQFYLKHRIIHWFNEINEVCDEKHNFDSIHLNRYMVGHTGNVVSTYSIGKRAGNLYFNYSQQHEFISVSLSANHVLYENNKKFPNTHHLFQLNFTTDHDYEVRNYKIERSIDLSKMSTDDFIVSYEFDINGNKNRDFLVLYDMHSTEELVIDDTVTADSSDLFDDFFNQHISTILQSLPTFLELYPQFGIKLIDNANNFKSFYNSLKELYRMGAFNHGFEDNLNVVKMVSI